MQQFFGFGVLAPMEMYIYISKITTNKSISEWRTNKLDGSEPIRVQDGVDAMRDGEDGAVSEFGANGALQVRVRLVVDRRRRFVEHKHACAAQQSARQTQQLPLPDRQVLPALLQLVIKPHPIPFLLLLPFLPLFLLPHFLLPLAVPVPFHGSFVRKVFFQA